MNIRQLCFAAALFSSTALLAQAPQSLQSLTTSYEIQRTTLTNTFETQIKGPRDKYMAALTAAQRTATAGTRTTDLAAITSEMECVTANSLPDATPPDLPRHLVADRRALVSALTGATRLLVPKQRELATNYLRSLVALENTARETKDQTLLEAVAIAKQRAMSDVEGSGGGQKNRNVVDNGDFSRATQGGAPIGWIKSESWKDVTDATVVTEGREQFLRFRRIQAIQQANLKPEKLIQIPARARYAEVTFRMRVDGIVKGVDHDPWPGIHLSARDARDEKLAREEAVLKENSPWRRLTAKVDLPNGTKVLKVSMGPFGAAGIVDFDDVVVEFK